MIGKLIPSEHQPIPNVGGRTLRRIQRIVRVKMPAVSAIEDSFIDCAIIFGLQEVIRVIRVAIWHFIDQAIWAAGLALIADPFRFVNGQVLD